jgi:hypothetical protein
MHTKRHKNVLNRKKYTTLCLVRCALNFLILTNAHSTASSQLQVYQFVYLLH